MRTETCSGIFGALGFELGVGVGRGWDCVLDRRALRGGSIRRRRFRRRRSAAASSGVANDRWRREMTAGRSG